MVTAERLRELLDYDKGSGILTWRSTGKRAGWFHQGPNGPQDTYIRVQVDGRSYMAHRLAWLHVTGSLPAAEIDHRNQDGLDNRWDNLRPASRSQNCMNRRAFSNKTTSQNKGIVFDHAAHQRGHLKCWRARIQVDGARKHLGRFETEQAATDAYQAAALAHFGEFARA